MVHLAHRGSMDGWMDGWMGFYGIFLHANNSYIMHEIV